MKKNRKPKPLSTGDTVILTAGMLILIAVPVIVRVRHLPDVIDVYLFPFDLLVAFYVLRRAVATPARKRRDKKK